MRTDIVLERSQLTPLDMDNLETKFPERREEDIVEPHLDTSEEASRSLFLTSQEKLCSLTERPEITMVKILGSKAQRKKLKRERKREKQVASFTEDSPSTLELTASDSGIFSTEGSELPLKNDPENSLEPSWLTAMIAKCVTDKNVFRFLDAGKK